MTIASTVPANEAPENVKSAREPALPFRGDTLLGVCEAVGQDLGINPTWLRVGFASLLLWNAEVVVIAYLALGLVVAVTRWMFPDRRASASLEDARSDAVKNEAMIDERKERKELLAA